MTSESFHAYRALSLRQPWAHMMLDAGKNVENRVWKNRVMLEGPIFMHASAGMTHWEYDEACRFASSRNRSYVPPSYKDCVRGGIVGLVEFDQRLEPSKQPTVGFSWHMLEQYGYVVKHIATLPFVAYPGAMGLFRVKTEAVAGIAGQVSGIVKGWRDQEEVA